MRILNLELIEVIVSQESVSIRGLTETVDRDYREVHQNLSDLESVSVVEFEDDGSNKKPILCNGAEYIDFSIRFPRFPST